MLRKKRRTIKSVSASVIVQPLPTAPKQDWRRWAQQLRSHLTHPSLDEKIVKVLSGSELYGRAKHILSYLAFGSEINLAALHLDPSKTFYVTRTQKNGTLTIHLLGNNLEVHRYGFLQPPSTAPTIDPNRIDLVFVPGLCFDRQGTRLGYGQGYYDRFLPSFPSKVAKVGVTAEPLVVDKLPRESFDSPMSHLSTEAGLYTAIPSKSDT